MIIFNSKVYETLYREAFCGSYPGYKPDVLELPNGDGKVDSSKRYAHIASKYPLSSTMTTCLHDAYAEAITAARWLGLSTKWWPCLEACALRILYYPEGSGSEKHTDFDLFTLNLWRDPAYGVETPEGNHDAVHVGEIGEILGLGPATPHWVPALPQEQRSLVFFALPDHKENLPSGVSVGSWVAERIARSRTYK